MTFQTSMQDRFLFQHFTAFCLNRILIILSKLENWIDPKNKRQFILGIRKNDDDTCVFAIPNHKNVMPSLMMFDNKSFYIRYDLLVACIFKVRNSIRPIVFPIFRA